MIRLRGVRHRYGKALALSIDRLDLTASTVLIGHNGAGKSTLLLAVAGLLTPSEGTVTIDGAAAGSHAARRAVSFVPDAPALFDDLTVEHQMLYVARLHGGRSAEPDPAAAELVELLDAGDLVGRLPGTMSKGQRQKASLLVATARPCRVLLTDEPTTGLDAESREALLRGFRRLEDRGVIIVSSTHDDDLIADATTQIRLADGQLVEERDESPAADHDEPSEPPSRWRRRDA